MSLKTTKSWWRPAREEPPTEEVERLLWELTQNDTDDWINIVCVENSDGKIDRYIDGELQDDN